MLPNIEQFCRACPQARATMYCDPNCVVKHKVCEVTDVNATVPPPNVILQWDPHSDIFHRISLEVHKEVYLDKAKTFSCFCVWVMYWYFDNETPRILLHFNRKSWYRLYIIMCPQEYSTYTSPSPLKSHGEKEMTYSDGSTTHVYRWYKWKQKQEMEQVRLLVFPACWHASTWECQDAQHSFRDMLKPNRCPQHDGTNHSDLKRLEEGISANDAYLQKEVLLVAPVMAFLCDNPRHSELINHAGRCAKKYCRMCMVCYIVVWFGLNC